jgi:hypothetical protein
LSNSIDIFYIVENNETLKYKPSLACSPEFTTIRKPDIFKHVSFCTFTESTCS